MLVVKIRSNSPMKLVINLEEEHSLIQFYCRWNVITKHNRQRLEETRLTVAYSIQSKSFTIF